MYYVMYYVYVTSGPSLLIESTDSMIITLLYCHANVIQQRAVAHHYYQLVGATFHQWKLRHQTTVRLHRQDRLAAEHSDHHLAQAAWTAWNKVRKRSLNKCPLIYHILHTILIYNFVDPYQLCMPFANLVLTAKKLMPFMDQVLYTP